MRSKFLMTELGRRSKGCAPRRAQSALAVPFPPALTSPPSISPDVVLHTPTALEVPVRTSVLHQCLFLDVAERVQPPEVSTQNGWKWRLKSALIVVHLSLYTFMEESIQVGHDHRRVQPASEVRASACVGSVLLRFEHVITAARAMRSVSIHDMQRVT